MGNKVDSDTYITDLQVYTDWYHAVVHWFEIISLRIVFYCKYKRIARVRQCVRDELRPAVHGHSGPRKPHGSTGTERLGTCSVKEFQSGYKRIEITGINRFTF